MPTAEGQSVWFTLPASLPATTPTEHGGISWISRPGYGRVRATFSAPVSAGRLKTS
jgi:hypothetical protein